MIVVCYYLILLIFSNICTINLLRRCKGSLESYNPTAGDIIRPWITFFCLTVCSAILNLLNHLNFDVDNTSDHLPVLVNLRISERILIVLTSYSQSDSGPGVKQKVHWSNFSRETVTEKYVTPLLADLADVDLNGSNETETVFNTITIIKIITVE